MPIPENYPIPTGGEQSEFELLPEDIYAVKITKLDLKENQPVYQSTETEDRFAFEFTITEEGQYKGRKLWRDARTIMSAGFTGGSPSWLYKIFCAVNGVQLDNDEAKTVTARSINEMEGKELRLVVKQKQKQNGDMKNVIVDALALKSGTAPTTPPPSDDISVEDIPF